MGAVSASPAAPADTAGGFKGSPPSGVPGTEQPRSSSRPVASGLMNQFKWGCPDSCEEVMCVPGNTLHVCQYENLLRQQLFNSFHIWGHMLLQVWFIPADCLVMHGC
jgi:hypothetical protein